MFKVALGQMEVIPGRPDLNTAAMLSMTEEARAIHAQMVIFPEMAIPGYFLGDMWEQEAFLRDCEEYGRAVIRASADLCIIFGNVATDWDKVGDDGRVRKYNACFIAQNGQLRGSENFPYPFRLKTLLPNYREFDDTRHFYSLRKLAVELGTSIENLIQPVHLTLNGIAMKLGCLLCEDGWSDDYAVKPISVLQAQGGVDLYINISSSPFTLGKNNKRNRVFSKEAKDAGVPLLYVNNTGIQNNGKTLYTFDGSSTLYNSRGEIVAACPPFTATLAGFDIDIKAGAGNLPPVAITEPSDIETIYQSLHYGISHFLSSIGMKRVVIGISGGIDSAVAAALYTKVVGPDNVLLVNMPSRYNSQTTKDLAAKLAENLGTLYTVMPIQDVVDYTVDQIGRTPITDLAANTSRHLSVSSFVKENIQARDRSSRVLAGIAAAFGGGFTCNANKSELTVGYSTLYGDQAGFLAALADLWKHQIYALAAFINEHVYPQPVIPQETITIVPSAELSAEQSVDAGQGDPIIYPYHDFLFHSFMERWNKATPEDILSWYQEGVLEAKIGCRPGLVQSLFASPAAFIADLERWWNLYNGMAVAKRIQAPPVLAVSRRAYGFDHREAQNGVYYTARYQTLKKQLLAKGG
ncbi:nad(+) synthetase [Lucifera butyrica]|uniref:Glutamine-dependent NAD(+) synthetase n=1 Tax=Lucifera butyrica TaxID=1351585 RepID=A0A498RHP5_9FIRM|nr:NAD(+) synthase [Lucifera butyrica]VBB08668.1 nad(+) synthetase [Lucifera butyrica]